MSCELQITNYKFTIDLPRPSFFLVFLVCSDLILQPLEGQEREEVPYGTILHINFYRKCFIKCISKFFSSVIYNCSDFVNVLICICEVPKQFKDSNQSTGIYTILLPIWNLLLFSFYLTWFKHKISNENIDINFH